MAFTYEEALAKIGTPGYEGKDGLIRLVNETSMIVENAAPNATTLLYSGKLGDTNIPVYDLVNKLNSNLADNNGIRQVVTLNDAAVSKLLNDNDFKDALLAALGGDKNQMNLILDGRDADGNRVTTGLWDEISRKFLASATGDIVSISPNAELNSIFSQSELNEILTNPDLADRRLNGILVSDLSKLANDLEKDHYSTEQIDKIIFAHVNSASAELAGNIRLEIDSNGNLKGVGAVNDFLDKLGLGSLASDLPSGQSGHLLKDLINASPEVMENAKIANNYLKSYALEHFLQAEAAGDVSQIADAKRYLNKIGLAGDLIGISLTVHQVNAALEQGDSAKAQQVVTDWVLEFVGGLAGGWAAGLGAAAIIAALVPAAVLATTAGSVIAGAIMLVSGIGGSWGGEEIAHAIADLFDGNSPALPEIKHTQPIDNPVSNPTNEPIRGDLKPIDSDHETDGVQPAYDALGNVITSNATDPGRQDTLFDSGDDDLLKGLDGNDTLIAHRGGDDTLEGGEGNDKLTDTKGNDILVGGAGSDIILDSEGVNFIYADDKIGFKAFLVQNIDAVASGARGDVLSGGLNDDQILGSSGKDAIAGGNGGDTISGGADDDIIYGDNAFVGAKETWNVAQTEHEDSDGIAHHSLQYDGIATQIEDQGGDDFIYGNKGNDYIDGGAGKNVLVGGDGRDILIGGKDVDILYADNDDSPLPDSGLADATNEYGDFLSSGKGNDTLIGSGQADALMGGEGDDTLLGGDGHDIIFSDGDYVTQAFDWTIRGLSLAYSAADTSSPGWFSGIGLSPVTGSNDAGAGGADIVFGGGGGDFILAGRKNDIVYGQAGKDSIDGGAGNDQLYGGDDNDGITGDINEADLSQHGDDFIDLGNGTSRQSARGDGGNDTILGGDNTDDSLEGDDNRGLQVAASYHGADYIDGKGGNDTIWGEGGSDTILGGAGADYLYGDLTSRFLADAYQGNDVLFGGAGNDQVRGDGGNDELHGGDDDDLMFGDGDGIDVSAHGDDTLFGDNGNDELQGNDGNDILDGGAGNDELFGMEGDDTLKDGDGNDALSGGNGNDTYIVKGNGETTLYDYEGHNSLRLEAISYPILINPANGDVLINKPSGGSVLIAQALFGTELTIESMNGAVLIPSLREWVLANLNAPVILTVAEGDMDLYGGTMGDTLNGGGGNNTLWGGAGNDTLNGNQADDTLYAGEDNDNLYGGNGNDVLVGGNGNDFLTGGAGNDTYRFNLGWGQDVLFNDAVSSQDFDIIQFGDGIGSADIQVRHTEAGIELSSAGGTDTITVNEFETANFIDEIRFSDGVVWDLTELKAKATLATSSGDIIYGFSTADEINGLAGNDYILGRSGDDFLNGGDDNDELNGEEGDDVLAGGTGNDILNGGSGSDTYLFEKGWGYDSVRNFDTGFFKTDIIQFAEGVWATDIKVSRLGNSLFLSLIGGSDWLEVQSYFVDDGFGDYTVEEIRFADGTLWDLNTIKAKAILGTEDADYIYGYATDDLIDGEEGNDILSGLAGNDTLQGGNGDDQIYGNDGNDLLIGNTGNDIIEGGNGADVYLFNRGWGQDTLWNHNQNNEIDSIQFGANITASDISVKHDHDGENLIIKLNGTSDELTVNYYFITENNKIDEIRFDDGTVWNIDAIEAMARLGTNADDRLYGSNVDDTLKGLDGSDELIGFGGNDLLNGGSGNDELNGGEGEDIYFFERGWGIDKVFDDETGLGLANILQFDADILPSDIQVSRFDNVLILNLIGTTDKIFVNYNFNDNDYNAVNIKFADGTVWDHAVINAKVKIASYADDMLFGTDSADTLDGLAGNDEILGLSGNDRLIGNDGNDFLYGNDGDDSLIGNSGKDNLKGGSGNDVLDGGIDNDMLDGGEGSDTYLFDRDWGQDIIWSEDNGTSKTDVIRFAQGISADDIQVSRLYQEHLLFTRIGTTDTATVMNFFSIYVPGNYKIEEVRFEDGTVWDLSTLLSKADALNSNSSETLVGTEAADYLDGLGGNDFIFGLDGDDYLYGGNGDDTINGGLGADVMTGGTGNDRFYVDNPLDTVIERAKQGSDTVFSTISYILAGKYQIENLTLTGQSALNATGNALNNQLAGNTGDNTLSGGKGSDTMTGGAGNDTYVVDNASDVINEFADEGIDTVNSVIDFDLGLINHVENLNLTGVYAIFGAGNALNNQLTGNSASNLLVGGAGNDIMIGRAGDDIYDVDSVMDVVKELFDGGIDLIQSNVTYSLSANVENLKLTGTGRINGMGNLLSNILTGNEADNTLSGSAGNDRLIGGEGNDKLIGGKGNDTYVVDMIKDVVTERLDEGDDTVESGITYSLTAANVENLTLTGYAAIEGSGNKLDNVLIGNSGSNVLRGNTGNDTLTGRDAADRFLFDTALNAITNIDTVTDFTINDDSIVLENSIFTKLTVSGALSAESFVSGSNALALDINDYLIYDTDTGTLSYDADGNGSGVKIDFLTLSGIPTITAADFSIN